MTGKEGKNMKCEEDYESFTEYYTSTQTIIIFISIYYSTFIHCTNSDFLIGPFVPCDPRL